MLQQQPSLAEVMARAPMSPEQQMALQWFIFPGPMHIPPHKMIQSSDYGAMRQQQWRDYYDEKVRGWGKGLDGFTGSYER